jgi:hypothetical protein
MSRAISAPKLRAHAIEQLKKAVEAALAEGDTKHAVLGAIELNKIRRSTRPCVRCLTTDSRNSRYGAKGARS